MNYLRILFVCIIGILVNGCNPNNPSPNASNWKFTVKINGVTHKAEGSVVDANNNSSIAKTNNPSWMVSLKISDPTHSSYISGQNGDMLIQIPSPSTGVNNQCSIGSSWLFDVPDAQWGWGYALTSGGPVVPNSDYALGVYLPINISDLGSISTANPLPLKGSYSGTIYVPSIQNTQVFNFDYTVPVNIEISFEAVRTQ